MGIFSRQTDDMENNVVKESVDYLADVKLASYSENTTLMEDSLMAVAESENEWNQMMQNVALQELAVLEATGQEMVYEAADKESFFTKVINWFKSLWSKIAGLFNKLIQSIQARVTSDKTFAEKFKAAISKGRIKVPAGGIKMTCYLFENLNKVSTKYGSALTDWDKFTSMNGENYASVLSKTIDGSDNATEEYIKARRTNRKANMEKIRAEIFDGKLGASVTANEFIGKAREFLMGTKSDTFDRQFTDTQILDAISGAKDAKDQAKKSYNELKKVINDSIKNINKIKKECIKGNEDKTDRSLKMSYANEVIADLKGVNMIYSTLNGVELKCITSKHNQARAIAYKLISYSTVKESVEEIEDSNLFNFELF